MADPACAPPRPPLPTPPQPYPIASATNRGPSVSDHPRLALLRSPDLGDRGRAWIHPPQRQVRRCCARPWSRLHPFRLRVRRCSCRAAPHAAWRPTAPSAIPVRRPPPQRAVLWRGTPRAAPPRHPLRSIQSFTFRKNLLAVQSSAQPLHGSAPNRLASCHIVRATIAFPPHSFEVYTVDGVPCPHLSSRLL